MQASQFQNLHAQELVVGPIMKPLTLIKKCELLYCCIIFEHVYFIAYDICNVFHSGPRSLANLQHLIIECTTSCERLRLASEIKKIPWFVAMNFIIRALKVKRLSYLEKNL